MLFQKGSLSMHRCPRKSEMLIGVIPQLRCECVLDVLRDHVHAAALTPEGLMQAHHIGVDRGLEQADLSQYQAHDLLVNVSLYSHIT